jgi:hypothetical protein
VRGCGRTKNTGQKKELDQCGSNTKTIRSRKELYRGAGGIGNVRAKLLHCKNSKARFPSIDGGGAVTFSDTG